MAVVAAVLATAGEGDECVNTGCGKARDDGENLWSRRGRERDAGYGLSGVLNALCAD